MKVTLTSVVAIAILLISVPAPVRADILTQVSSAAGLVPDDGIGWAQLGPDLTGITPPVAVTTNTGKPATLTGVTFTRFNGSTFNGDFLPQASLLSSFDINTFTALSSGIEIDFGRPVFGVGAQVGVDAFFTPFQATLELFGAGHSSLGTVHVNGSVQGNGDGSAPFLGALSKNPIFAAVFTANADGVTINDVALQTVPEPASLALLGSVLAGLALRRRRV